MPDLVASRSASGNVLELEIRRAERRNALDRELTDDLVSALEDVDAGCVLLTAEGPSFCAGYDLRAVDASDREAFVASADQLIAPNFSPLLAALDRSPVLVVAAIQGAAVGGGFELALACDIRVAADDARFGLPAGRLGLVYSQSGIERTVRAVGPGRARQLLLLGEEIGAETAREWGVAQRVVDRADLLDEARRVAATVAGLAPLAQRGNRRILQLAAAGTCRSEGPSEEAGRLRRESLASTEFRERVMAFRERRPARLQWETEGLATDQGEENGSFRQDASRWGP